MDSQYLYIFKINYSFSDRNLLHTLYIPLICTLIRLKTFRHLRVSYLLKVVSRPSLKGGHFRRCSTYLWADAALSV